MSAGLLSPYVLDPIVGRPREPLKIQPGESRAINQAPVASGRALGQSCKQADMEEAGAMNTGTERPRWPFDGEALIVDDNAPVRDAVVAQLGDAGCVCHTAASYEKGSTRSLGIRVAALRESEYYQTVVRDAGPGVAAEDRGRIFEPPFAAEPGGTTLAPVIRMQIVERDGGTVDLLDEAGPGAGFRIRPPRQG